MAKLKECLNRIYRRKKKHACGRTGSLLKVVKWINHRPKNPLDPEWLRHYRMATERAGRITAPRRNIAVHGFRVERMRCEVILPGIGRGSHFKTISGNSVILYAHGGGYVNGGLDYARVLAAKMAVTTGFPTYTFAYRLAPEHPYPAALADGIKMWNCLLRKGYAPEQILLAGDSAGGNLVLRMAQWIAAKRGEVPGGLLLFSPWTDMTGKSGSYRENEGVDPILTSKYIRAAARAYMGEGGDPSDPRYSPLFGDLSVLPPTYIMVGRNEILLDDSVRLYEAILRAGGRAELDLEERGWHVYQQMPLPIARRAMRRLLQSIAIPVSSSELQ